MSSEDDVGEFRAEVEKWFESSRYPRLEQHPGGEHEKSFAVFLDLPDDQERALLDAVRDYRRERYDAGLGALSAPIDAGGRGLPTYFSAVFAQIEQQYAVPVSSELISVTTGLVAPTIALFGTPEQVERYARPMFRTDLLACQLFSEPDAGSDLAALGCRAVHDGDGWRVTGQKVWTSGARHADYGLLLARTDPGQPKHRGITAFLVPMAAEGVEVRPIRQMSGGASFNEVFLDGTRLGDDLRIGAEGEGWKVGTATLGLERGASAAGTRRKGGDFDDVLALAKRTSLDADDAIIDKLADLYVISELRRATVQRVAQAVSAGQAPGPVASIGKLVASSLLTQTGELAYELLGRSGVARVGDDGYGWREHLLGAPGYRLAGGTDQIQRNIIAERVLGLPREPHLDKDAPWSAR